MTYKILPAVRITKLTCTAIGIITITVVNLNLALNSCALTFIPFFCQFWQDIKKKNKIGSKQEN